MGGLVKGPEKRKPYRDVPLLGAVQAMILKKIDELGSDASGSKVHEELILETDEWFESSVIYLSIKKMADKDHKFIEPAGAVDPVVSTEFLGRDMNLADQPFVCQRLHQRDECALPRSTGGQR